MILLPAYKKWVAKLKLPERLILRDVATQWNSMYDILTVALEYRKVVNSMCTDRDLGLQKYELGAREWTIARQLTNVLKV